MQNTHGKTRLIGRAVLVALLVAPALGAQDRRDERDRWEDRDRFDARDANGRFEERRLITWRGTVDDDVRIHMRGNRVQSQIVSGAQRRVNGRVDQVSALPRRDGYVRVQLLQGRGQVHVIQQPNANNDFTTIIRVKDAQGGAGAYRFAVFFDPADNRRTDRGRVWENVGGDVYGGSPVFRWSGSVDGDLRIAVRRDDVNYQVLSGDRPRNVSSRVVNDRAARQVGQVGQLGVSLRQGRGSVHIEQQPSSYNNYTAIIRVRDHQGGYGYYDFDLVWR